MQYYSYIKLEPEKNRYFCIQQRFWILAWILFFKRQILRPVTRTHPAGPSIKNGIIHWVLSRYGRVMQNISILRRYALYAKQPPDGEPVLTLPCFGHLCVPVHRGYKLFDLRRHVTVKVFDPDVPSSVIDGEIKLLQYIAPIDFAPKLIRWNLEDKWYEEHYLPGSLDASYHPMDSHTLLSKFQSDVVHKLHAIMVFQQPEIRRVFPYVKDLATVIASSRLASQPATIPQFQAISTFVARIIQQLHRHDHDTFSMVFSHGDFAPANMLNSPQGVKLIDWECAGFRSALFDFYCYFFYRSANRAVPVSTLKQELDQAFPVLMNTLAEQAQTIYQHVIPSERTYRWIFYIEMVCRLVEREVSDKNLDVITFISRYLEAFRAYEELAGIEDPPSPQRPITLTG